MSPILKREVAETVRQARRLAAAAGFADYDEYEYELDQRGISRSAGFVAAEGVERLGRREIERSRDDTDQQPLLQAQGEVEWGDRTPRDSLDLAEESLNVDDGGGRVAGSLEDLKGLLLTVSR